MFGEWIVCALLPLSFLLSDCRPASQDAPVPSEYIRVEGIGATAELAKQNAFSNALEQHLGALVVSERESHNLRLAKDEILVYSSGYVHAYRIISQDNDGTKVKVIADVSISSNKIKDRILSKSSSITVFDGSQHETQHKTFINQHAKGDLIWQNILNDYPIRAFNLEQKPYSFKVDNYRGPVISIPYKLTWNYNYLVSMRSALDKLADNKSELNANVGNIIVISKDPNKWIGDTDYYRFNDTIRMNMLYNVIVGVNEVRINIIIKDKYNGIISQFCYSPDFISGSGRSFYGTGSTNAVILHGNVYENGVVNIYPKSVSLTDYFTITLQIIGRGYCTDK